MAHWDLFNCQLPLNSPNSELPVQTYSNRVLQFLAFGAVCGQLYLCSSVPSPSLGPTLKPAS